MIGLARKIKGFLFAEIEFFGQHLAAVHGAGDVAEEEEEDGGGVDPPHLLCLSHPPPPWLFWVKTLLTFLKMDLGNFSFVASAYSLPCGLGSLSKTSSFSPCSLRVWTWSQLKTGVFASLHQKEAVIVVFLRGSGELDKVPFFARNVEYVLVGRVVGEYCRCTGRPPPYQPVPNSLLLSCYTSKPLAFLDFFLNFFLGFYQNFLGF